MMTRFSGPSAYQVDAPKGYVTTNFRTDYTVRSWCNVSLEVNNAFNVQYEEMVRFRMPGRSYAVGLTLKP